MDPGQQIQGSIEGSRFRGGSRAVGPEGGSRAADSGVDLSQQIKGVNPGQQILGWIQGSRSRVDLRVVGPLHVILVHLNFAVHSLAHSQTSEIRSPEADPTKNIPGTNVF